MLRRTVALGAALFIGCYQPCSAGGAAASMFSVIEQERSSEVTARANRLIDEEARRIREKKNEEERLKSAKPSPYLT